MRTPILLAAASFLVLACGGGDAASSDGAGSAALAAGDRNACHLLTHDEVTALVGRKIITADQSEAGDTWSTCDWEDESGTFAFGLTAYWSGGKGHWDTWRMAQGLAEGAWKQAEGVTLDSVVSQGPVSGIGDAAYFSELLPSLVLKGDVLFEIKMVFVPDAETKFRALANQLIAKAG